MTSDICFDCTAQPLLCEKYIHFSKSIGNGLHTDTSIHISTISSIKTDRLSDRFRRGLPSWSAGCGQGEQNALSKPSACTRLSLISEVSCCGALQGLCVRSSTSSSEVEGWVRMIRGVCQERGKWKSFSGNSKHMFPNVYFWKQADFVVCTGVLYQSLLSLCVSLVALSHFLSMPLPLEKTRSNSCFSSPQTENKTHTTNESVFAQRY